MYQLRYKHGLLFGDIVLKHNNVEVVVNDVIIDTGASQTIILTDFLTEKNISFDDEDELVVLTGIGGAEAPAIRKRIAAISMGDIVLNDMLIDFGVIDPNDRINGLIGMDFLKQAKTVIDVDGLTLSRSGK